MSPASSNPAPGRRTVLIVEDDPGTRHVLSSGLATTLGMFDVLTAEHGREAIELLDRGHVDVVVTDLAMPIMDGFALIGALSNRAAAPPVIVLSALAPTTVAEGLDGYDGLTVLRKPAGYAEVGRAILDTLERHALGQVAGIPLPSVLQLVEAERRSCALSVTAGRRRGKLYFESGRLINAFSEDFGAEGEAAAYDILSWQRAAIEFERLPETVRRTIDRSTQSLLIEVARRQDAARGVAATTPTATPPTAWHAVPVRAPAASGDPLAPDERATQGDVPHEDADAHNAQATVPDPPTPEYPEPTLDEDPEPFKGDRADTAAGGVAAGGVAAAGPADALWAPDPANASVGATQEKLHDPAHAGTEATPPGAGGPATSAASIEEAVPASAASAPHTDLVAAIERLTHRVRDADAALAAVADEVAAFRDAQRRYEEAVRRQEDRRRALEEARRDVARLARQILERIDGVFDLVADPDAATPVFEDPAPEPGGGPR